MPRLIVLQQAGTARQIHLTEFPFVVGRASTCELVLDGAQVSRAHAVFESADDVVRVRDLKSNNGTRVNGERIDSCVLADGDEVQVGKCVIRFLAGGGEVSDAEALRLITVPGKLTDLELRKLAPT